MAKRFTDTDKWKKPFIRGLSSKYKLLWLYILDDCDISGLWQVDLEVAEIRIGEKFDMQDALTIFIDHIVVIDNGEKWFIPSFLEFQYGAQLSKTNNIFKSIDRILQKYSLYKYLSIEITETGTTISSYRNRISQKVRDRIFIEAELVCQYCSEQKPKSELVVDHLIPLSKGGDNDDGNLVCACVRCNSHKTDILPNDFLQSGHFFIKPTDKLLSAINSLKAPYNLLQVAKDKDKDKVIVKENIVHKSEFDFAFESYIEMRKKIKKPATEHAIELVKKKLDELSKGNELLKIKILNQSIVNCWQDIYELKQPQQGNKFQPIQQTKTYKNLY